ncbi:hypothetical protein CCAN2_1990016 [Capnocytophaga canimorsus]|nr:hypothetical protein CCAN2_1990016 [Capnocytophaga canimorsus]
MGNFRIDKFLIFIIIFVKKLATTQNEDTCQEDHFLHCFKLFSFFMSIL